MLYMKTMGLLSTAVPVHDHHQRRFRPQRLRGCSVSKKYFAGAQSERLILADRKRNGPALLKKSQRLWWFRNEPGCESSEAMRSSC